MPKSGESKKTEKEKIEAKNVEAKAKKKIDKKSTSKEDKVTAKTTAKRDTKSKETKKKTTNKVEKPVKKEETKKKKTTTKKVDKQKIEKDKVEKQKIEKDKKEKNKKEKAITEKEKTAKNKVEEKKTVRKKTQTTEKTAEKETPKKEIEEKKKTTELVIEEKSKLEKNTTSNKNPFVFDIAEEEMKKAENNDSLEYEKKTNSPILMPADNAENSKKGTIKKKEFQTLEVVILVILTCVISLTVGSLLGIRFKEKKVVNEKVEVAGEALQNFLKDYNYLIENYYGEIDEKELLNTAFKSIVDSLGDAYSGAIDDSSSNNFDIELKGDYEGLGIEIINDSEKNILIYSIIPNSPASKTDIKVGDKLLTVNNINVRGMTTSDFIKNIVKGSGATEFVMVFDRDGQEYTVTVKKEAITLESVTSKVYQENGKRIAYIKVSIFAENTYEQFKNELTRLETEGFESLILDLRDNSGGHLTTVKNMISLFLDSSHVIYQTEDKNGRKKVYSTGKETKEYPIVIVGNALSASASEVMIGALTEEYGAVLIGNQSFGKGTVQELHSLTNGEEYKFTTKKWLTPKGNWVHNNGIQPKIEVTLSREYYGNPVEENDNQLKAAINYLAGIK